MHSTCSHLEFFCNYSDQFARGSQQGSRPASRSSVQEQPSMSRQDSSHSQRRYDDYEYSDRPYDSGYQYDPYYGYHNESHRSYRGYHEAEPGGYQ